MWYVISSPREISYPMRLQTMSFRSISSTSGDLVRSTKFSPQKNKPYLEHYFMFCANVQTLLTAPYTQSVRCSSAILSSFNVFSFLNITSFCYKSRHVHNNHVCHTTKLITTTMVQQAYLKFSEERTWRDFLKYA